MILSYKIHVTDYALFREKNIELLNSIIKTILLFV
jgi:hypothetical protein